MELKKYKLGEICDTNKCSIGKKDYFTNIKYLDTSNIIENKIEALQDFNIKTAPSRAKRKVQNNTIIYSTVRPSQRHYGLLKHPEENLIVSTGFTTIDIKDEYLNKIDADYLYYNLIQDNNTSYLQTIAENSVSSYPSINPSDIENVDIIVPNIHFQRKIASVLFSLDSKIALNRRINAKLEQIAKRLYDYWFVQFNFPDKNGKPYKSNGGKMVWNEVLKREVPEGWEVKRLSDFICKNNTGDWGADEPTDKTIEVGCIRGADIIALNDLPKRFIKSTNTEKLLSEWDMVIEVSGGSPVQATGRCALITPGVIKRNGNKITCSNFCHAFSFKDYRFSAYFYYLWKMFYDNGIMFNYEGKTSGIKNFMTETFLANKWVSAPESLAEKFFGIVKETYAKIDTNIAENNKLIALRDRLLPLLMNGQVEVKG